MIEGGVTWSPAETHDGVRYISGDLTVAASDTLTIMPGQVLRIASDDDLHAGDDTTRVEIVVEGLLQIEGTLADPVVIEGWDDLGPDDWVGIRITSTGSASLSNVVIRNAARAVESHAATTLTNCTITDCGVAIDAHSTLTATDCLLTDNADSYTAIDVHAGSPTFTNCTVANNAGSAMAARDTSMPGINKSVLAFNGGPAVRAISGWSGSATMQNSVLDGNATASGSLTDSEWETTGTDVYNLDPAFCDASSRDYHLYAFSPAAPGALSSERWGALEIACAPDADVAGAPDSFPFPTGDSLVVVACPAGDGASAVIRVDLDDAVMTRDVGASELWVEGVSFSSKVFSNDSSIVAVGDATSGTGWTTTISHAYFGGSGVDMIDVLLNGWPLTEKARLDIRTPDLVAPFGVVNAGDFAYLGTNYESPPKPYKAGCDFNGDGAVGASDLAYFATHIGHQSPLAPINAVAGSLASTAEMGLEFATEYVTATHQRLYVDVDLDNIGATTACVLMLRANNPALKFVEWQPSGGDIGDVLFTPTVRDEVPELFIGVLVDESFAGSSDRLGRLVFDAFQAYPVEITEDNFVLSFGEVLGSDEGGRVMTASMTSPVGRHIDTEVTRIYHNRLEQNYPNPFNPTTSIAFSLETGAHVRLSIYDVAGRRVRTLLDEQKNRGAYQVQWDGRNENKSPVSTGVYFYKLVAGSFTSTRKMTLIK
jgi:hypothetical protein